MTKRFYIAARRGCPRRTLDAGRAVLYLEANGWKPAERPGDADLLLVYGCGGFTSTEERTRRTLARLGGEKKREALLVETGCLLRIRPGEIRDGEALPILPEHLDRLDGRIGARIPWNGMEDANVPRAVRDLDALRAGGRSPENGRDRLRRRIARRFGRGEERSGRTVSLFGGDAFLIRIAVGCRGRCSYCAIRVGAGPLRSKPPAKILEEYGKARASGRRRIVLIAEDTGDYGVDIGTDLAELLRLLLAEPGETRLFVNDLNPARLLALFDRLLPLFRDRAARFENIVLPVQSGSDAVLRRMGRGYGAGELRERLRTLFSEAPSLRITTHVIVGFPGETEEDLEKTRRFLEDLPFHRIGVYRYQERSGTKASLLEGQIPPSVIRERAESLRSLGDRIAGVYEP